MSKSKDKIAQAIEITELKQDYANLERQQQAVLGAMQYIASKIAALEKPVVEETEGGDG